MFTKLPAVALLFVSLLLTPDAFGIATYRATGRAVEISSNGLLLPPNIVAPETVFALRYSLDETQVPADGGSGDAFFRVDSFNGFVGDDIAFSGSGAELEFYRDFPSFPFSYFVSPDSSLVLQGIAADLISVTGLFVDVASSPEFVNSVIDSRQFPVEEAVGTDGDWSFSATGVDGGSLEIRGVLDSLVLVSGPTQDPADDDDGNGGPGMGDGGDGMDDGGDGGPGMDDGGDGGPGMDDGGDGGPGMDDGGPGMGDGGLGMDDGGGFGMDDGGPDMGDGGGPGAGGGAVPEPGSALIWVTLAAIGVSYSRRKKRRA